jgi:hypothetical protein
MADKPYIWNIGDEIPVEIFVMNQNDGTGLADQQSYITLTIQRASDNYYWTGLAWSSTKTDLTVNQADATNQPGRYTYTLSSSANAAADRYIVFIRVSNPPTVEGDSYEVHVSRQQDVHIYESEPV